MMANRRSFIAGITSAIAMPSIVRAESIMKIATLRVPALAPLGPDVYISEFGKIWLKTGMVMRPLLGRTPAMVVWGGPLSLQELADAPFSLTRLN